MYPIISRRRALCLSALLCLLAIGIPRPPAAPPDERPPSPLEARLLAAWASGEPELLLDTPTPLAALEATYFALLDRAPAQFWVADRFAYIALPAGVVAVKPTYLCPPVRIPILRAAMHAQINTLLAALPPQGSEYARAYALHDALAAVTAYGYPAASPLGRDGAYTAYSALVDGTAVCRGYAMAYLTLLAHAGIAAEYVASPTMAHGWVRARLDGRWLHIDVTWNDRSPLAHRYFARTDAAMRRMGYTGW